MSTYSAQANLSRWEMNFTDGEYRNSTDGGTVPVWFYHILIPCIYSVIIVTGLIGNGLVIYLILRHKNMKTVPNMYILNLAAADFLFILVIIFLAVPYVTKDWPFGEVMCKLVTGIDGMNMFTGIFTLTAMSVDRYLAIVHAVWSQNHRTIFHAQVICILLWLVSIAVTIPLWMYATAQQFPGMPSTQCNVNGPFWVMNLFSQLSFAVGFVLPLVVIMICYTQILIHLAKSSKRQSRYSKSKLGRVGLMILMAVAVFVICWLPFWTIRLYLMSGSAGDGNSRMALNFAYYASQCLTYANSSLNPVVYACFKQDFRKNLRHHHHHESTRLPVRTTLVDNGNHTAVTASKVSLPEERALTRH
ncbi:somatostatin receptor type 4-like [Ptychodera flava]|uniref:somatostatin receptor type 4-like n=1 Tax=Ptychodera flava TaxID=63121 RepID=UPI00396A654E